MANEEKSLNERLAGLSPDQLKALLRRGRDESARRPGKPEGMVRNPDGIYHLSKAQERMWFLHELTKGEAIYNNPVALRVTGEFPLNIDVLVQSLGILMERHEILRTTFHVIDGKPVQQVHQKGKPEISYEDLRQLPLHEREARALTEAVEHGRIAIPLDQLPLLRFRMLHLCDLEYMLLINPHHIISDGWSNAVFAKELSMTYASLENHEPPPFPVPKYQYIDFTKWEKDWMGTPAYREQLDFWKAQLEDLPEPLRLPYDFPRPPVMTHHGCKEAGVISAPETEKLRLFCQRENITLFHLLFGCFGLLMSKYSGQQDIIIGVPVARRNQLAFQQTLGLFINTLPLRVRFDDSMTTLAFLKEIKAYTQQAFQRQELPFEKLIEEVNPDRNLSANPVFQVHFVHQNIPSLYSVKGLAVKPESIDYSYSKFDLNFWVEEANQELILSVTYPVDIFSRGTIRKLLHNYRILLNAAIQNPEETCSKLNYFPPEEVSVMVGKTVELKDSCGSIAASWMGEFKAMVRMHPRLIAVRDISRELTYSELDHEAGLLADALLEKGIAKGDRVGILLPRDASIVISILAIFKAGAAYVPLDVHLPAERLKFIANDAGLRFVISSEGLSPVAAKTGIPVPHDLAYVIYTSGTTGSPKGVCVGSEQLLNYSKAVWKRMKMNEGDSFATISSIAADLGNTMIFPPLIHGGTVVIVPEDYATDASLLADWFDNQSIDCLKIVPSHLISLLRSSRADKILPRKLLMLGGEKCGNEIVALVRALSPNLRIINHYGPTEATIGSLTWEIPVDAIDPLPVIPIGFPLDNTAVYIVRDKQLLPKGIPGEILLSGKNLARGYFNQPLLTREKFTDDPFRQGERVYFTGDFGKMNEDGAVEFLGRLDHQIKIRGYRVETREIENVLNNYPSVERSVVLIPENTVSVSSVQAAVTIKQGQDYNENDLRMWLAHHLPSYMVPSTIHVINHFPITPNGKTDLKELRRIVEGTSAGKGSASPPRDLTELVLLNIFKDILKTGQIGIEDNFFDLGGHSLLAIELFAAIEKEFHISLPLATLFERGSVMKLAEIIRSSGGSQQTRCLVPIQKGPGEIQLFLVHPAGGNVLCYYELAREMGTGFLVYGLQAEGLSGKPVETVSDMARYYLEEMELPECMDNLIIGGWSMGALIAFEMARQVKEKSGECPRLLIIDQLAPQEGAIGRTSAAVDPVERMLVFAGKVAHLVGRPLGITPENLVGKTPQTRSEVFLKAFKSVNLVPPDMKTEDFHGYLEQMIHHNEITSTCTPGKFDGKTLLIRARDPLPRIEGQEDFPAQPGDLGWGSWIRKGLSIVTIPGNHVSVIARPYVKELAIALKKWIKSGN